MICACLRTRRDAQHTHRRGGERASVNEHAGGARPRVMDHAGIQVAINNVRRDAATATSDFSPVPITGRESNPAVTDVKSC
jgi:hypothetical protein